jgi:ornithine--oxo-acid transaminase
MDSSQLLGLEKRYGAHNYKPLPVVLDRCEGVWVHDIDGRKFLDMLSAYSALSHGHCHPRLVAAAKRQLDRITLTSRAFHNDQLGPFCKQLAELCGQDMVLPMNTGAEAVETALKAARRWGYRVKKVAPNEARIVVFDGNFHGRTISIVSFSADEGYRDGFGPFTPGFDMVPYGDFEALEKAITPNTIAVLVEPIQGEAGVVIPPEGFLRRTRELCDRHHMLMLADEVQTGLGRTGRMFACDHEGVKPDAYILGKALGGGILPVSAVVGKAELLEVFEPGSHGSTFGGNPLAAAVGIEAMTVLKEEKLTERAEAQGKVFRAGLAPLVGNGLVLEIRGKGLLNAAVIDTSVKTARRCCEDLMARGLLCKETHETVIRFAPPLIIDDATLAWSMEQIRQTLQP